jgi:hypothetical protein
VGVGIAVELDGAEEFSPVPRWMVLIMAFFLYCFVHDAFDQSTQTPRVVVPRMEHRPVAFIPEN